MLKKQKETGKYYCGICAAPGIVFLPHGLLDGEACTSYPGFETEFPNKERCEERVVVSNKLSIFASIHLYFVVTSRAPGTAMEFAFALAKELVGAEMAGKVQKMTLTQF
jgi:protein deglycase